MSPVGGEVGIGLHPLAEEPGEAEVVPETLDDPLAPEGPQRRGQFIAQLRVERVHRIRAVQRDCGDSLVHLEQDFVCH